MYTYLKTIVLGAAAATLAACASVPDSAWKADHISAWKADHIVDEFTDRKICRVQYDIRAPFRRCPGYICYHFYAETDASGEMRVGVRSTPAVPIAGDLQLRVDRHPAVIISSVETPIDYAPSYSEPTGNKVADAAGERVMTAISRSLSPYRVTTGQKAKRILRQILAGKTLRFRTLGVNSVTAQPIVPIEITENMRQALSQCGINSQSVQE